MRSGTSARGQNERPWVSRVLGSLVVGPAGGGASGETRIESSIEPERSVDAHAQRHTRGSKDEAVRANMAHARRVVVVVTSAQSNV